MSQQLVSQVEVAPGDKCIAITCDLKEAANVKSYSSCDEGDFFKIKKESLSGDAGRLVKAGKQKQAYWNVLEENPKNDFRGEVSIGIKARPSFKPFILAQGAYSPIGQAAGGLMVGAVGTVGFYVRGESSFTGAKKCPYMCNKNGFIGEEPNAHQPFYSGAKASCEWQALGGLVVRMGIPLYLYAGGGYGVRERYWETIDGQWINNIGYSYKGFAGDIGLMGRIKHVAIAVGVNTINFQYLSFNIGLGCAF